MNNVDNIKISVIVPVYNAEQTIRRMMDSLLGQTFDDYELLLIDDGSTDASGAICDSYAQKHAHIRVIHKSNEGVSAARQCGIEAARGAYVIHADSDDWVESTMLEELYSKARETDADVVICDFYTNKGDKQSYVKQKPSDCRAETVLRELFQQLHGSCCNKLVRRACYSNYGIRFPEGINHCEDLLTWAQLFQHQEVRVAYQPKAYYHYCANEGSITHNYTRKTYEMRNRFQKKLEEVLPSSGFEKEIANSAFGIFTEAFIYDVLTKAEIRCGLKEHKDQIRTMNSIKWRVGFAFLAIGCPSIAHRFIHY